MRIVVHLILGQALGLQGRVADALEHFAKARQLEQELNPEAQEYVGFSGIWEADLRWRFGKSSVLSTRDLLDQVQRTRLEKWRVVQDWRELMMACHHLSEGDLANCKPHLEKFRRWALESNERWADLCGEVTFARMEFQRLTTTPSATPDQYLSLRQVLNRTIDLTRQYGFGVFHIDLLLIRAQLALFSFRAEDTLQDVEVAIDAGIESAAPDQLPLVAARHEDCRYAWAIAEGLRLRGEAKLLIASRRLGRFSFSGEPIEGLPPGVRMLIENARINLEDSLKRWHTLRDPDSTDVVNSSSVPAQRLVDELQVGMLPVYPTELSVIITLQQLPNEFDERSQSSLLSDLAGTLNLRPEDFSISAKRGGSTVVVLRFANRDAFERFASAHASGSDLLANFYHNWQVSSVRLPPDDVTERSTSTPPNDEARNRVFISYSHKDQRWLNELMEMMDPLIHNKSLDIWWDRRIDTGQEWREEIDTAMASCSVAFLMVSPAYLASDFIKEVELPYLEKEAKADRVKLTWVHLKPSLYRATVIAKYQAIIEPLPALANMTEPEYQTALVDICNKLKKAVASVTGLPPYPSPEL